MMVKRKKINKKSGNHTTKSFIYLACNSLYIDCNEKNFQKSRYFFNCCTKKRKNDYSLKKI